MTYIEENREKLNIGLKKYFDEMVKTIYAYEIPFIEYKGYVIHLKNALTLNLIDDYMYYVVILFNAEVILNEDNIFEYDSFQDYLEDVIIHNMKESLDENRGGLTDKFKKLVGLLKNHSITLDKYVEYCELLKTCMTVDVEFIDYEDVIKSLINAEVKKNDTYQDNLKYYDYQIMLRSYLALIEKPKEI